MVLNIKKVDKTKSQTFTNLAKAFVGESEARNRYTMYSSIAKKEGYEQIASIFLETSEQEREHASILYKTLNMMKGKTTLPTLKIETEVPLIYGTTIENLKSAITGETYEKNIMYIQFSDIALQEGFKDIALKLRAIAVAETHHFERFSKLLTELENKSIFKKTEEIEWTCRQCGYVHKGKEAPNECPLCEHPKSFYQKKLEEY
ncbi:MAG: rubrerythrin family protein [Candidatus Woesearchaeota archaeon]|jgi:rubrerythrin